MESHTTFEICSVKVEDDPLCNVKVKAEPEDLINEIKTEPEECDQSEIEFHAVESEQVDIKPEIQSLSHLVEEYKTEPKECDQPEREYQTMELDEIDIKPEIKTLAEEDYEKKSENQLETKEELFQCSLCKRSYCHKRSLVSHMRVHTGQGPLTCDICGKIFLRNYDLRFHMLIHTGQKPYTCDVCGNDCKNRWRVLRSSYVRLKNKKAKSGEGLGDHKEYYLSQCMQFLQPFTKSRMQSENIPLVNNSEPEDLGESLAHEECDPTAGTSKESDKPSHPSQKMVIPKRGHQGKQLDEFELRMLEYFKAKRSKSAESPDLCFFRGLLPFTEGFTSQERLKFQKSVLDVISSIYDLRSLELGISNSLSQEGRSSKANSLEIN